MNKIKILIYTSCLFLYASFLISCKKSNFLDAKPQSNLSVPTSIADYQALLEYDGDGMPNGTFGTTPYLGVASTDNYYLTDAAYNALGLPTDKTAYIWLPDIFNGVGSQRDWNLPYKQILNANVVLDGLNSISRNSINQQSWNYTYGDALFLRAYAFWNLAQVFCPPYDSATSMNDLGLPLRLSSDVNKIEQRSNVQKTYSQILEDLKLSSGLVSTSFSGHLNRASKIGVYAFLARVYLSMRAYDKAGLYSDSSLQLYNSLIDYNTVSATSIAPFANTNAETIFQSITTQTTLAAASNSCIPDSSLFNSYATNDLRSQIFFRIATNNVRSFKLGYEGISNLQFTGLTTSELFLIRAECNARAGNTIAAINDLNALLIKRWKTGTFVPYVANNSATALSLVLVERRKELVFRGQRWMDLRRLNKEGYAITLKRIINGQTYILQPNSPLYVLPIPPDEIVLSGLQQNIR